MIPYLTTLSNVVESLGSINFDIITLPYGRVFCSIKAFAYIRIIIKSHGKCKLTDIAKKKYLCIKDGMIYTRFFILKEDVGIIKMLN